MLQVDAVMTLFLKCCDWLVLWVAGQHLTLMQLLVHTNRIGQYASRHLKLEHHVILDLSEA